TYSGIAPDVLCFIASQLGLRYEVIPARDMTVSEKLKEIQSGQADVFMPLSYTPERAKHGLFTLPYYESYYAVVGRKANRLPILGLDDLSQYQVSVVEGAAFAPILLGVVPDSNLHLYDKSSSDEFFEAVRSGDIDVAVFSKDIFIEKRYRHEYFDLEVIHTLYENPRSYGFYFSSS